MKRFTALFRALDATTRTSGKLAALQEYFCGAGDEDAAWATWLLAGNRPKRSVTTRRMREWVAEAAGLPLWLMEESYEAVGDLGETMALVLDTAGVSAPADSDMSLATLLRERVLPLSGAADAQARELLSRTWRELSRTECFLFQKMIGGTFRVGVSKTLLARALAELAGVEKAVMARRLMGAFEPSAAAWRRLIATPGEDDFAGQPYPFYLASPLEGDPDELGPVADWLVERKWDGIRAQLIRREGEPMIWSRGEEMIGGSFPEIVGAARSLPVGTVVDGELLAWRGDAPLPFGVLQRRLGRKQPGVRLRREFPVAFMAYDLLEAGGSDIRGAATAERRGRLEDCFASWREALLRDPGRPATERQGELFPQFVEPDDPDVDCPIRLSPAVEARDWGTVRSEVARSRELLVEGVMLKRRDSAYGVGRERGRWWKWKVDPLTIDAVMIAAQQGHGRRAGLFTDYTFGVWRGDEIVPVAKAYSGLTDEEIDEVDRFVRANTTARHGPVRGVKPELVFELAFEGIQQSTRHRSGVAVRFPRIQRWRRDKSAPDADTLETLVGLAEGRIKG